MWVVSTVADQIFIYLSVVSILVGISIPNIDCFKLDRRNKLQAIRPTALPTLVSDTNVVNLVST